MRRVFLLRHARSRRDDPTLADFDRPLEDNGRDDAALIGAFMKEQGVEPDCALCSPSVRTRQTLQLIEEKLDACPRYTFFPDDLYDTPAAALLAEIKAESDSCRNVLLIGHNPGLHELALDLADRSRSKRDALERMEEKFPPAALAVFDLDIDHWSQADLRSGVLSLFKTPKELRRREANLPPHAA